MNSISAAGATGAGVSSTTGTSLSMRPVGASGTDSSATVSAAGTDCLILISLKLMGS